MLATIKTPAGTLIFVSPLTTYKCTVKMKEFLLQEPEPEPGARIRFWFFLGQNGMVPAVPVPQHCYIQYRPVGATSFC